MRFMCLIFVYVTSVYSDKGEPITSDVLHKQSPANVLTFAEKTYYFITVFQGNYFEATRFCNKYRKRLVSITSQAENDRLGRFAEEIGMSLGHFWTSGTNLPNNDEWIWLSSGSSFTYTDWYPGEPNKGSGGTPENCVEMRSFDNTGYMWNDAPCINKFNFICESDVYDCKNA